MALTKGALRAIKQIKSRGAKALIASEGVPVKQWDKLIRLGLSGIIDGVFVSRKKTAAFFSHSLRKAGVSPSDAVMVGDRMEKDALPALKAGMRVVLIGSSGKKNAKKIAHGNNLFYVKNISELPQILRKFE
jgi:putative hydrolase of the HAD superfamily